MSRGNWWDVIDRGNERNISQCHFDHNKSHMNWSLTKTGRSWWDADQKWLEKWHATIVKQGKDRRTENIWQEARYNRTNQTYTCNSRRLTRGEGRRHLSCTPQYRLFFINTLRTGDADLRFYITTLQGGWRKSTFLTRAFFPCTIHLIMQYIEPLSEWSCWRMFIETWPHSELIFRHRSSSI